MTHFQSLPRADELQSDNNDSTDVGGFQDTSSSPSNGITPLSKDIPLPDEDEIFPNREVPEEEDYLPDEKEIIIEEPPKESEDPYFPGKDDDFPVKEDEEFPQSDPQ
jgi:hypothetical protein